MLTFKSLTTPSAMLAAFTLVAAPSFAQEREHGRQRSGQESSGRSAERAQPRNDAPRQQAVPRAETRQQAPPAQSRPQAPPAETRQQAPRAESPQQAPRVESRRQDAPRFESRQQAAPSQAPSQRFENRRDEVVGRAVPRRDGVSPRGNDAPRYDSRYQPRYDSRYESHYYAPRYYSPGYGSRSYYRPYTFRPRFSIGFGIFSGYPVPYSYSYGYPIEVYGYGAPRERVTISPGSNYYYGGVALEITPNDADVYVDGEYAGRVQDFDGTEQPLTLSSGTHQIEVQAQGYEPMRIDVQIQAGQVIPYRGDLRRY